MFWKKKKTRLELLREGAEGHAHAALDAAQNVLHHASDAVHETLEHAPEKLGDFKSGAAQTLSGAVSRIGGAASSAASSLGAKAGTVAEVASKGAQYGLSSAGEFAHEKVENAHHALEDKREFIGKKLSRKARRAEAEKHAAEQKVEAELIARETEIVVTDGSQKWIWLGVGLLAGAAIGILLAPSSGRRNRAALRDKLSKGAHSAGDLGESATRRAHDLSNRASGVAHNVASKVGAKVGGDSDDADDVTIADRVRTALGQLPEAQGLERINVESSDGVVTLRGPILDESSEAAIVAAVGKVAGVREVISNFLVDDDTPETFVG